MEGCDNKYPAFAHTIVFEKCLIPLQSVLIYRLGWIMAYIMCQLLNVCLVSHCILPDRLHSRGQCLNARSLSVNLSLFIQFFFQYFFVGRDPQKVYCRQSSYLDLGTARVIIPVSTTHQISIWSTPTQLYHNWLLIWSRQPIRSRFGHRTRYYITIDFWSGLDNPSDAKSCIISQTSLSQYYMFGV